MDLISTLDFCQTALGGQGIPTAVGKLVHLVFVAFQIVVPLLLIIWGMLDFAKSVVAKKEEDIKKYQKSFVSRLISALVVFLIVIIVQFAVNLVSSVEEQSSDGQTITDVWGCTKKFINGVDDEPSNNAQTDENSNDSSDNV